MQNCVGGVKRISVVNLSVGCKRVDTPIPSLTALDHHEHHDRHRFRLLGLGFWGVGFRVWGLKASPHMYLHQLHEDGEPLSSLGEHPTPPSRASSTPRRALIKRFRGKRKKRRDFGSQSMLTPLSPSQFLLLFEFSSMSRTFFLVTSIFQFFSSMPFFPLFVGGVLFFNFFLFFFVFFPF